MPGVEPDKQTYDKTFVRLLSDYPHTKVPTSFRGSRLEIDIGDCLNAINGVKRESGPGIPMSEFSRTKGGIIDTHLQLLVDIVCTRLVRLSQDCTHLSARELVELGLCDPVRLFIKEEPHSTSKIEEERLRLISNVSLNDEVIDRMLFGNQNEYEIDHWLECPSKPGMGMTDEMAENFVNLLPNKINSDDVSGYDFNVRYWMMMREADVRIGLTDCDHDSIFRIIVRNRFHCMSNSVYALSDGRLFTQIIPGVQKSGAYTTSSSNSRMRVGLAYDIGADWCIAMGDDALETPVDQAVSKYLNLGIKVTDYLECGREVEFCSHMWDRDKKVAKPRNWAKSLYRFLAHKPDSMQDYQFLYENRHSEQLEFMWSWVLRARLELANN